MVGKHVRKGWKMSEEESKSAGVSGQERAAITVLSEARWQQRNDLLTCVIPGWHSSASGERQLPPTPGSESHWWEFTGQEQAFRQAPVCKFEFREKKIRSTIF